MNHNQLIMQNHSPFGSHLEVLLTLYLFFLLFALLAFTDSLYEKCFPSSYTDFGKGNGNPLQYSCLENPVDRGACWAAVYGVAQSRTRLKRLSSISICIQTLVFLTLP